MAETPARTATRARPVWGAAQDAPLVAVSVELDEVELSDDDPEEEDDDEPEPELELDELELVVPEATWKVTPLYWSRIKVAACSARP